MLLRWSEDREISIEESVWERWHYVYTVLRINSELRDFQARSEEWQCWKRVTSTNYPEQIGVESDVSTSSTPIET
jgi:hypothetical protein